MKKLLNVKFVFALAVFLLGYGNAFSQTPNWHLVPENPNYPKNERVVAGFTADVATYGNGTVDATAYLQDLLYQLDRAGNRGINMWNNRELLGGGVLYLPAGTYRVDGQLIIPKGVTIRGDWKKPVKGQPIEGTIIQTNQGRGVTRANTAAYENASFIIMQSAAGLMDVAIHYPQQDPNNIQPYAPTILLGHRGGPHGNEFANVKNVTLVNSYDGVIFSQIGGTCYTINGLYGTPLNIGLEIDRIVDIGRAEHISFSPMYWAFSGLQGSPEINHTAFRNRLYENATGVLMRRNDWSYTLYLDVEGYNKGFWAAVSLQQDQSGGLATPNGHNYGFNLSNCKYGIYYESSTGQGSVMFSEVKIAGCEFGIYFTDIAAGVAQLYKSDISATKCAIYSNSASSTTFALLESTVSAGKVLMQGGTLLATNNNFNNPQPQIEFEANSRGSIVGNRFAQAAQIREESVFQNVIDHAAVPMQPFPAYYEFIPRETKMSGSAFIVATAAPYNAPRGNKDNCAANPIVADATSQIQNALNAAASQGGGIVYLPPGHYRIDGQLTIPTGVELKGSTDVSSFPVGPGSVLAIYNQANAAVVMNAGSGMRGINFNYPTQVFCTVMPNPIDFPFSIQGRGDNIYIVNVAMRASNRGIDLASYSCSNFYIDFLTGYFFREGVNIKDSRNGVLSNMQCNTIVYNNGDETKFGQFPLSNRGTCNTPERDPYFFNSENLTFLTLEDVDNILLYGNFNYNANIGIHVKSNVNGLALGFALDDDRTGLLLDGSNINLQFINLQSVALQRAAGGQSHTTYGENSTYFKTTENYTNGEVTIFNSAYWGYAGESGIVKNGAGTINIYGGYFQDSGVNSFANINNGNLNIVASVVNPPRNSNPTYNGSATGNVNTVGSITNNDNSVMGNTNLPLSPQASTSGALNNCNTWTATATYTNSGNPMNIVNCSENGRWNSGWQNQGQGQNAVSVTVNMQAAQTFNQVVLTYGSAANDGPETYMLEVSNSATGPWTEVARGSGRNHAMTMISFDTQMAQYIRITKPASNTGNFWAIDKLFVTNIVTTNVDNLPIIPDGTPEIGSTSTDPIVVTGVTMANVSVLEGNTITLVPVVLPTNATNRNVSFAIVTNPGNAISLNTSTGVVTGLTAGAATVRVTTADGGFTATATITVTAPSQCDPIRTVRFQSNDNGGAVTAINLTDNNGTIQWTANVNDNSAWYEIPVENSTTDFYYKNVGTGRYMYRENTGKLPVSCDWQWERILLSTTNAKTDYYTFRLVNSTWGGRSWVVNVAGANFANVTSQGAFVLSGINNNHTTCGMPAYPAVVATALPNDNNYWHSTAVVTVNANAENPDCEAQMPCDIIISAQPQSRTYTIGNTPVALTVTASGTGLTYQWYRSTDNSNSTPVNDTQVGTNANNFTPDIATVGTAYYYVVVSNNNCERPSNVAAITVNAATDGPTYPEGYPMTMAMQNPLFWQFPSPVVNAAGNIRPSVTGNFYSADPSARVWDINGTPTLFVYASHDMQQGVGCDRMDRYHVFSTTDLVNWTNYGEIFNADSVPWSRNNTFVNGSKFMWAPDCVQGKDGKYYYYFPHPSQNTGSGAGDWGNNWKIGIAVSDHPASNFTILENPLSGLGIAENRIDPHVFVDEGGQAYFYVGGGGRCFGGRLNDDMITIDGEMIEMQGLNDFHEATWVHKYNGKYYLSHSDNGGGGANHGDRMKYAMSDNPLGPWTDMGVYINATGCGTIHGSIVEFNNQWYAFYHTDYISNGGEQGGRSVHFDPLYYNADGTIQLVNTHGTPFRNEIRTVRETNNTTEIALRLEAEDFNDGSGPMYGGATYGYHDRNFTTSGLLNTYRPVYGMQIEARGAASNGYNLGGLEGKEFTRYTIYVEKAGLYDIDCYVASANNNGRFQLHTNGITRTEEIRVNSNGGWGDGGFVSVTALNVPLKEGENLFEFRVLNGGFNIDYFVFRQSEPYAGTPFYGQPINVPGRVEAEDYDRGCQGVAFFDTSGRNNGFYEYRNDCPTGNVVDLERDGGSGRINISWTSSGEWTKYTLNVTETGIYDITVRVASGNGASGSLSLSFDDIYEYPSLSATTASWGTFTDVILRDVELTAGIHVMKMTVGGNINIDYYDFVKQADLTVPDRPSAIVGNVAVCRGETTLTYSVTNVTGVTYTWNFPTGWTIRSGQGTNSVTVDVTNSAVNGTISVTPSNSAGNGEAQSTTVTVNVAPTISNITAPSAVCTGTNLTVPTVPNVTNNGSTVTAQGWEVFRNNTWVTFANPVTSADTQLRYFATNACGTTNSNAVNITVNTAPTVGNITAPAAVCAGTNLILPTTPTITNADTQGWQIFRNNAWIPFANPITSADTQLRYFATNACGTTNSNAVNITINTVPTMGNITAPSAVCTGTNLTLPTTPTITGADTQGWQIFRNNAWVTFANPVTSADTQLRYFATNTCGTTNSNIVSITVNAAPVAPASINGSTTVCANSAQSYSVAVVSGATSYEWTLPTGWTTAGSTTNNINVTAGSTGGNISVRAVNTCGGSTAVTLPVAITSNVTPSVSIVSNRGAVICAGESVTFTATPGNGGSSPIYQWRKNGLSVGQNSVTYSDNTLATSDVITCVMTSNDACVSGNAEVTSNAIAMTVNTLPATPAAITGATTVCAGSSQTYSINAVSGATSYEWTLPSGWTSTGSTTNNSINVTVGSTGGSISVSAVNTCGSASSNALNVTIIDRPTVGNITALAPTCTGTDLTLPAVPNVIDATTQGWEIYRNNTWVAFANPVTSSDTQLRYFATNACGTTYSNIVNITLNAVPAQPSEITGSSSVVKGFNGLTYSVTNTANVTYQWTTPTGWNIVSGQGSNSIIVNVTAEAMNGIITVTPTNTCGVGASSSLPVTVQEAEIHVTEIILSHSNKTINIGEEFLVGITIEPWNATNTNLEYSIIGADGVVSIAADGTVTGLSAGTVTKRITAPNGVYAECEITVNNSVNIPEKTIHDRKIIAYNNTIKVDGIVEGEVISIYNLLGVKVYSQKASQNSEYITIFMPGMYTVIIEGTNVKQKVLIVK